ncbi:N-6 DNA methylase [Streptomyces sp. B3I8]|uniref:N-6 DNA methylase n=1 Tax=Streptomyces sp. B3I8 TaxID=3042303 RepID=UPI002783C081|nr:N-6 DNA methylase [Streptomyces sp. B3I8]MDQ0787432.1 putative DNA-binding transcriptional regulator AlpA [Streptomyces sp. B3I8]
MQDNATEVTAAGIARLAGVGRAAVSNWRRRHADFPKPVGGTETSPAFALAEVEEWLRAQGKLAEVPLRERVRQQLAGHPEGPVTGLLHAGCVLLLLHARPTVWLEISAGSDDRLARLLPGHLEQVLTARFGARRTPAVRVPDPAALRPSAPLLRGAVDLAAELGARQTYEYLLGRHLDANPRQYTLTPAGLAALMAELAGPARTALDPACGTGALLRAVAPAPEQTLYGQDGAPELAALTALRLALHSPAVIRVAVGDSLRADAHDSLRADVVLCHPPFNERNWGHEELAYDPRWEYGLPARTESELAWVQHALARLKDGGTAVLLMPPAAASRRSGRRIRADLLRRGTLRAVVALPVGAAPPHGIPLHLWVLRRPDRTPAQPRVLLVDTGAAAAEGRGGPDWQAVREAVLDTWRDFERTGTAEERPGVSRALPVVELLDDDVDLAPARHLPPPAPDGGADRLIEVRARLGETLRLTADLAPPAAALTPQPAVDLARPPVTTVGELARGGALVLRTGGTGGPHGRVLTDHDVLCGDAPSGTLPDAGEEPVLLQAGDVVLPVLGGGPAARVVDGATAGAALGRHLTLLRPDPAALDPWFLAGFLRGSANHRRASSYASTSARLDVRRLRLPRLPLEQQRRYGRRFRELARFEEELRLAGRLGAQFVRGMYDGLTDGSLPPE